jgi:apolipoprotein D and lipocalin family protein
MKKWYVSFLLVLSSLSFAGKAPLPTVESVDINRYLGKWYEISRFDQSFQRGCTATEANYSLRSDGDIKVLNRCRLDSQDGELKESIGRAWVKDKKTNSKLKVQFFLKNFKFFLFAGKYWIIDLDENYQYVMVGAPNRKYLWILSRQTTLAPETYNRLVEKAENLGFDTNQLLKTIH